MLCVGVRVEYSQYAIARGRGRQERKSYGVIDKCMCRDYFLVAWYFANTGLIYMHTVENIMDIVPAKKEG